MRILTPTEHANATRSPTGSQSHEEKRRQITGPKRSQHCTWSVDGSFAEVPEVGGAKVCGPCHEHCVTVSKSKQAHSN
jgi:hypothetical protein